MNRRFLIAKRLLPILLADVAKPYIGGQAVLEGVMMRSPKSFVVAVRRPDGAIAVREEPWSNFFTKHALFRLPFLRGAVVLIESLWNGYVALDFSAQHAGPPPSDPSAAPVPQPASDEPTPTAAHALSREGPPSVGSGSASAGSAGLEEKSGKGGEEAASGWAIGLTLVFSLVFGLGLFVGLPHLLTWGIGQLAGRPLDTTHLAFHVIDGAFRLGIFLLYIWAISKLPDIRRVFQYHGAEHKTIWAYEKGAGVEVPAAAKQSTLHPRCGTSFLLLVVGVSIVLFASVFPLIPRLAEGELANTLLLLVVKLPMMFPIAGISYEIQRLAAQRPSQPLLQALIAPGMWMQRITTKEPSEDQLEIAVLAMRRCIAYEDGAGSERRAQVFPSLDEALSS